MNPTSRIPGDVLVVDDQPGTLRLLMELLQARGYRVRPVPSGRLALQAAQRQAPDLILLDIAMPGLDGFAVCRQLKLNERLAGIPVIFLSACDSAEERLAAFRNGGVDYISKPFQAEEVEARVATHLRLAQMRRDLEAANRELDLFAQTAAHDLRAPLHRILNLLDLLTESLACVPADAGRWLDELTRAALRMDKLVQDLLAFSSSARAELHLEATCLGALAREVLTQVAPEAGGRPVRWELEDLPVVRGDPELLRLVLQNLMANALKFTARTPGAVIQVGRLEHGSGFLVRDNGVGFEQSRAGDIFEPFVRLHSAQDFAGTGLGLAQVQRIISRLGGRVWAEAEPGKGATFRVSLPPADGAEDKF
jgi:signal transduction histidine kinase